MPPIMRRVVTGHDDDGNAIILTDAPPVRVQKISEHGPVFYEIWNTREMPVRIPRRGGEPPEAQLTLPPPHNGTRIRILDIPPETDAMKTMDANNVLYAYESSSDYNPEPNLEKIKAPLLAINSADDLINPPDQGILEKQIKRVPKGKMFLIPESDKTQGHGSHTTAMLWKDQFLAFLKETEK